MASQVTLESLARSTGAIFGIDKLRPGQDEVIRSILATAASAWCGRILNPENWKRAREYDEKAASDQAKLEQMMLYGQIAGCRWRFLHDYFQKPFWASCGDCDNCLDPLEKQLRSSDGAQAAALPADATQHWPP